MLKKKILGYTVLRIKEENESQKHTNTLGYVIDLLVLPDHPQVTDALLTAAIRYFDENSVNLIQAIIIKNHPYEKQIRKYEFLNSKNEVITFYKSPDEKIDLKNFKSPEKAHIQYGDTDWI